MRLVPFATSEPAEEADAWLSELRARLPDCDIRPAAAYTDKESESVELAIVANPDPSELARFPAIRWVQSVWAGVERLVDRLPPDIEVVRLVDPVLTQTMAEAVLAHVLFLHRNMPHYLAQQRSGLWRPLHQPLANERNVAVLGLGELGRAAAECLKASGFRVLGWSRSARRIAGVETHSGEAGLPPVMEQADIVVILLPLTSETRGLIDARILGACSPGTSLINVARGPIVERAALMAALDEGRIGHAILDVFDEEPLPPGDPFWTHPSVTVMPHVAAQTNRQSASAIVARNIDAYFDRGVMPAAVDRAAGYRARHRPFHAAGATDTAVVGWAHRREAALKRGASGGQASRPPARPLPSPLRRGVAHCRRMRSCRCIDGAHA